MNRFVEKKCYVSVIIYMSFGLLACDSNHSDQHSVADGSVEVMPKASYPIIEWVDLMPMSDIEALMKPPEYISQIEEGALEDQIGPGFPDPDEIDAQDPYQRALVSTDVIESMNNKPIRLPGFVVPLEFDDEQTITQFFLVPFFGACIHVPPPPPNQIILVNAPEGVQVDVLYDPFWVYGVIKTTLTENDVATSAYSLDLHHFEIYSEE